MDAGRAQPGHDERLVAARWQLHGLAKIGHIRRIGDDDMLARVGVDPAQALAFVNDDRLVTERPVVP